MKFMNLNGAARSDDVSKTTKAFSKTWQPKGQMLIEIESEDDSSNINLTSLLTYF